MAEGESWKRLGSAEHHRRGEVVSLAFQGSQQKLCVFSIAEVPQVPNMLSQCNAVKKSISRPNAR
jgi:hypothetical protein